MIVLYVIPYYSCEVEITNTIHKVKIIVSKCHKYDAYYEGDVFYRIDVYTSDNIHMRYKSYNYFMIMEYYMAMKSGITMEFLDMLEFEVIPDVQ